MLAQARAAAPAPEALRARLDDELRARVHEVVRLTPNIVEVVVKAPMAARAFQPGQFYRLQNYETLAPRIDGTTLAMEGLALTGACVDREQGPALDDRPRDGRLVRSLRAAEAGRAGDPDGADRHADRDAGGRDRAAGRRRARQRGAVLDRPRRCGRRARGCSISPATRRSPTATRSRISSAPPTASCGAATRRRASPPAGRRIAPLSATSSRRSRPTASGALGPVAIPLAEVDRIIAIGSDGMMNAVAEARRARLKRLFPPRPSGDRLDQLADAMHDEGDLRAVPAAPPRPGDRRRDGRVLLLQPGPGAGPRSISRPCAAACRRTACRKS